MSGVLQPVGPEPARTYWIRRGILLAVVLLVALGVILAVSSLTKAAVATAPPPVIAPVPDTASPSTSAASTPAASTPAASTPAASTPAASTPTGTPSASPNPRAGTNASASAETSTTSSSKPSAKPRPTTTTVGTPDCRPADLRVTLKGDRSLFPGQNNRLTLALINEGAQTCLASVTEKNFELKIYSGKDRIWSSRDCSKVLADFDKKLAAQADIDWVMTWNGERSVQGKRCKTGSDTPRAGTYWATAQLRGADPVQLRMIIS